jgi:hypothetical protein
MEYSARQRFESMLNDIIHFQALRARCLKDEYDYIMYTRLLDERLVYLQRYHADMVKEEEESSCMVSGASNNIT